MNKEKLHLKHCIVCGIRCDVVGKRDIMVIKNEKTILNIEALLNKTNEKPEIGHLMCRKHERAIRRNEKNALVYNSSSIKNVDPTASSSNVESNNANSNENPNIDFTSNSSNIDFNVDENNNNFEEDCQKIPNNQSQIPEEGCYNNEYNNDEPNFIMVDMPRTYASHSFCFICKAKSGYI